MDKPILLMTAGIIPEIIIIAIFFEKFSGQNIFQVQNSSCNAIWHYGTTTNIYYY